MLYYTDIELRAETTCSFEFMQKRAYGKSKISSWFKSLENLEVEETYLIYKATLNPALYQMVKNKSISFKSGMMKTCPLSLLLLNIILEFLARWRNVKEMDRKRS